MLPQFIQYSEMNNVFCRKKINNERDNVKRFLFLKLEYYKILKYLFYKNKYSSKFSYKYSHRFSQRVYKYNSISVSKNKCLWTGRAYGVEKKYKTSALIIKRHPSSFFKLTRYNK